MSINNTFRDYYMKLYNTEVSSSNTILLEAFIPKLVYLSRAESQVKRSYL